ncbi:hypothetical protein [Lentibacillus jeotgali]|uniref:hypothetical protein n=1 Tax=Lentibacillus jeotgali TaxID=558169 RepID=UPI00110FC9AA|nr:hypothetical protein [Lentibacillus jeotgali]
MKIKTRIILGAFGWIILIGLTIIQFKYGIQQTFNQGLKGILSLIGTIIGIVLVLSSIPSRSKKDNK